MSDTERADLDRCVQRLERDPSVDNRTTFDVPGTPGLHLHDDGVWRILYAVPDDATIGVRSVAHALDLHP